MALHNLYETTNFVVSCEDRDVPGVLEDVLKRASPLKGSFEFDFQDLSGLFGATNRFGAGNKIQVVLDAILGGAGTVHAANDGFKEGGSTLITIEIASLTNSAIMAAFAAELAEILLSLRGKDGLPTLDRGSCDGEGFSLVMMARCHPEVYYDSVGKRPWQGNGPYLAAVHWMNEPTRPNYIGPTPYASDGEPPKNGCAVMFLYYLHHQLSYSWNHIIEKLSATLPETFTHLTGRSNGLEEMRNLLNGVFPLGELVAWEFEDPFPLRDATRQAVQFDVQEAPLVSDDPIFQTDILKEDEVELTLCRLLGRRRYRYQVVRLSGNKRITASAIGFGRPVFLWAVAGQTVTGTSTTSQELSIATLNGWDDDPNAPNFRNWHPGKIRASCVQTNQPRFGWNESAATSYLDLAASDGPPNTPGHLMFSVTVSVQEAQSPDVPINCDDTFQIDLEKLKWLEPYNQDLKTCAAWWTSEMKRLEIWNEILILRTLPDPPPLLRKIGILLEGVESELKLLRERAPELAKQAEESINRIIGLKQPRPGR